MAKKQFKSESKRLLDLMINSIYTNKDIFLRELISNASDAIDKLYYRSLTDKDVKVNKDDLEIKIDFDTVSRTITIEDNGIGMNSEELETNLGTIAKSGTLAFKEMVDDKKVIDVIGQFGVGFYSAFMVSDKITVTSKKVNEDKSYIWTSSGADGYTIEESDKETNGTVIKLYLKEDTEENNYSDYLTEYKLKSLIKKYSDYIKYPIKMEVTNHKLKDEEKKEYEEVKEIETINSMIPIWKKNKKDVTDEEYQDFYTDKFYDYEKPLQVIHSSVEGLTSYNALLFIPSHASFDFYTKEYEKGLALYSNGVMIMEKCSDLLPDYFSFVKGIVDTEDISLNISREMLQQTNSVKLIARNIENKIKKELETMINEERDKYKEFFKAFGIQIKFGVYNNYGVDKDKLKDLLMFTSNKTKDLITLKEYVENMKDSQESIYYACGETFDKIDNMPQVEQVKEKDYEILYLTEYVDEFTVSALMEYEGKKFINVSSNELDLDSEEEKENTKKLNEETKDMLTFIKDKLSVTDVKFTNKLKNHPVCLTTKGGISTEMEKVINAMPTDEKIKAETVLEINENHPIKDKLMNLYETDKDELEKYAKILYSSSRLIEGLPIDNPTEISNLICELISK